MCVYCRATVGWAPDSPQITVSKLVTILVFSVSDILTPLDSNWLIAPSEISTAPFTISFLAFTIAQAMLVRQQAEAMVKARRLIVKGAVDISEDAVNQLETKGVKMSETEKTKVVTNLLTVICGDQKATPTLSVG